MGQSQSQQTSGGNNDEAPKCKEVVAVFGDLHRLYGVEPAELEKKTAQFFQLATDQETKMALEEQLGTAATAGLQGDVPNQVLGGGLRVYGGLDDLQQYANSSYSRAKEKLIRAVAKDVFRALSIKGADRVDTAPIKTVVEGLSKLVPNPKKGQNFTSDYSKSSAAQRKTCHALASALNKNYGAVVINTEASEAVQCQQIAEIMHTLLMGLHTEFMTVAGDVLRAMRNIRALQDVVDASYKKQTEIVRATGDARLTEQSKVVKQLYDRIKEELNRQMAMLTNMLNITIGPTGRGLIELLEESREFKGMIRDIHADLGTNAFSSKLGYLLTGVSNVAQAASKIQKALNTLGMSISEFKAVRGLPELRQKVFQTIQRRQPNTRELDKLMAAAEIIYRTDYNHKDIVAELSKKGRGEHDEDSDDEIDEQNAGRVLFGDAPDDKDDDQDDVRGNHCRKCNSSSCDGNCDAQGSDRAGGFSGTSSDSLEQELTGNLPLDYARRSLNVKLKKKEKYRTMLLKDFRALLRRAYRRVASSGNYIAAHIGEEIPVTEELARFINAFKGLPSLDKKNIENALSGYARDPVSKQEREQFMNSYELVIRTLDPLVRGQSGQYFAELQDALRDMMRAIDSFGTKVLDSLTEIHIDRPEDIREELRNVVDQVVQGGAQDRDEYVDIRKIQNEMAYYFSIADIKKNLKVSSEELKSFSKGYQDLVGQEGGWLRDQITLEYQHLISAVKAYGTSTTSDNDVVKTLHTNLNIIFNGGTVGGNAVPAAFDDINALTIGSFNKDHLAGVKDRMVEILQKQQKAKVELIIAAENIDIHMQRFTDAIAKNPDSIKNLVKLLESMNFVADFFDERTGDHLAALFEAFPHTIGDNKSDLPKDEEFSDWRAIMPTNLDGKNETDWRNIISGTKHYYEMVDQDFKGLAGNPLVGLPLDHRNTSSLYSNTKDILSKIKVLDNILEVFTRISDQYNVPDNNILQLNNLLRILREYIIMSSYTSTFIGWQGTAVPRAYELKNITQNTTVVELANSVLGGYTAEKAASASTANDHVADNKHWMSLDSQNVDWAPYASGTGGKYGIRSGPILDEVTGNKVDLRNRLRFTSVALASIPKYDQANKPQRTDADKGAGPSDFWNYHDPSNRSLHLDVAGWLDNMYDTDLLFIMLVKSIFAKIFTAIDAYRLFHRPTIDRQYYDSLSTTRTIMGGSEQSHDYVRVVPGALELYLRLPLLAEWYRSKYGLEGDSKEQKIFKDTDGYRLTLVPNINGIWSGFMNLMFDKYSYVDNGYYSQTQIQNLITEINKVYNAYKSSKYTTRDIVNAFVVEVNRAYGFLKKKEIDDYLRSRYEYLKSDNKYDAIESEKEYNILGDDAESFGRGVAPSDKYIKVTEPLRSIRTRTMAHLQQVIVRLRESIDNEFRKYTTNRAPGQDGLNVVISSTKHLLERASNDREKYNVVMNMIQGTNRRVRTPIDHIIMLHESVAAPLYVLFNVFKCLAKFNGALFGTSNAAVESLLAMASAAMRITKDDIDNIASQWSSLIKPVNLQNAGVEILLKAAAAYVSDNAVVDQLATDNQLNKDNDSYGIVRIVDDGNGNKKFAIDAHKRQQYLLTALLDMGSNPNKLVVCEPTGATISIRYERLEELCVKLLAKIKSNVEKLRPMFVYTDNVEPRHTPTDRNTVIYPAGNNENLGLLSKYVDFGSVGSVRWLEHHLVEQLFHSQSQMGLQRSIIRCNESLQDIFKNAADDNVLRTICYYPVSDDAVFNIECEYPDIGSFPFNVAPFNKDSNNLTTAEKDSVAKLMRVSDTSDLKLADAQIINKVFSIPTLAFYKADEFWNTDSSRHSLLFAFNTAYRELLRVCLGDAFKIDPRIIGQLANGSASNELNGKAFNDICTLNERKSRNTGANQVGRSNVVDSTFAANLSSPARDGILSLSNAIITKNVLYTHEIRGSSKLYKYLLETDKLTELPQPIRDRWRIALPYFSKIFKIMADRSNMLKNILLGTSLRENIASAATTPEVKYNQHTTELYPLYEEKTQGKSTKERAQYFEQFLTKLSRMCLDLVAGIETVYKDLSDIAPTFMEYKIYYNKEIPVVPASNVILPMLTYNIPGNLPAAQLLLPSFVNYSENFRFNAGARFVLGRSEIEPRLEHFPGAKEIYNSYAQTAQRGLSIDDYKLTILPMVELARFINDGVVYGKLFGLDKYRQGFTRDYVVDQNIFGSLFDKNVIAMYDKSANPKLAQIAQKDWETVWSNDAVHKDQKDYLNKLFQTTNDLATVLSAAENSEQTSLVRERVARAIKEVEEFKNDSKDSRVNLRISNILEMNIVPVNVHAFMREVPFANILNYAYTYDRLIHDFFVPGLTTTYLSQSTGRDQMTHSMINLYTPAADPRTLMVKMLCYPYANLVTSQHSAREYYSLLGSLFNGNTDMQMLDRPMVLSDQFWHKVLLNTVNPMAMLNNKRNLVSVSEQQAAASGFLGLSSINETINVRPSDMKLHSILDNLTNDSAVNALVTKVFGKSFKNIDDVDATNIINNIAADLPAVPEAKNAIDAAKALDTELKNAGSKDFTNLNAQDIAADSIYRPLIAFIDVADVPAFLTEFPEVATAAKQEYDTAVRNLSRKRMELSIMFNMLWCLKHFENQPTVRVGSIDEKNLYYSVVADVKSQRPIDNDMLDSILKTEWIVNSVLDIFKPKMAAVPTFIADEKQTIFNDLHLRESIKRQIIPAISGTLKLLIRYFAANQKTINLKTSTINDIDSDQKNPILADYKEFATDQPLNTVILTDDNKACVDFPVSFEYKYDNKVTLGTVFTGEVDTIFNPLLGDELCKRVNPKEIAYNVCSVTVKVSQNNADVPYNAGEIKLLENKYMIFLHMHNKLSKLRSQPGYADYIALYELCIAQYMAGGNAGNTQIMTKAITTQCTDPALRIASQAVSADTKFVGLFRKYIYNLPGHGRIHGIIHAASGSSKSISPMQNARLELTKFPPATQGLKYFKRNDNRPPGAWHSANNAVTAQRAIYLAELGRARFDTKLIRNLTWLVQNQRVMRAILGKHLSWIDSPVIKGLQIPAQESTEYHHNQSYDPRRFTGETYSMFGPE